MFIKHLNAYFVLINSFVLFKFEFIIVQLQFPLFCCTTSPDLTSIKSWTDATVKVNINLLWYD